MTRAYAASVALAWALWAQCSGQRRNNRGGHRVSASAMGGRGWHPMGRHGSECERINRAPEGRLWVNNGGASSGVSNNNSANLF